VAVGTGSAFVDILKKNPHGSNTGIDLTTEMLSRAKSKAEKLGIGNYSLEVGDAYALPYPDETFDLVRGAEGQQDLQLRLPEAHPHRHRGEVSGILFARGNRFFARRILSDKVEESLLGKDSSLRKKIQEIRKQKSKRTRRAKAKVSDGTE
jgi:hypothetical protein